jgi:membrane fusion protein (multidrug efflux system)
VVAVQEVRARTVPVEFEYPSQVAGSREVEVRARVGGILLKRNYAEGAVVRAANRSSTSTPLPSRRSRRGRKRT